MAYFFPLVAIDFWGLLMRTEMRVALAIALAVALIAALWLAAPYMPEQRFAEQCPWYHCEEDIPLPQAAKFGK